MNKRLVQIIIFVMIALLLVPLFAAPAFGTELNQGAQLFEAHCAGCHLNGGNIVRRGKNLKQRAMEKNGYVSVEAIANLITQGKGNMSAYGDKLSPAEIQAISHYVLEQSQANWSS
ncbi:c-type cytochrome [Synechococcus moorigangaii CMS01]|nr:c-type cytochrome [Synechococcus moorigangaii CMS01]